MPRKTLLLAVVLGLLLAPAAAFAQNAVLMGVVRSDAQMPVAGALVSIAALDMTTVTNEYGQYRMTIPAERVSGQQVTIEVSSLGYRPASAQITLRAGTINQNLTMVEQAIQLDEVVVTGTAGRNEKRAQAAQISTINAARVAQVAPVQSVANLLQARTPGVVISNNSGTSGTAQTIRIRGASSFTLSNNPLVFVDGIRVDGGTQQIYGVGGQSGSRLNDIKIEDIESMEVVKGPAAATLYGADANAGVINIITKSGRQNSGFVQTITAEYGEATSNFDAPDNFGVCSASNIANPTVFTNCQGRTAGDVVQDDPLDRVGAFGTGRYRNLMYTLSGGGENFTTYFSLGADDENGTLPNNEYGHRTARARFNYFPHQKLNMEVGFGIIETTTNLPINDNNIYGYLGGGLLGDARTVGNATNDGWYGANRPADVIALTENSDKALRFQPRVSVNYSPFDWFTNRVTVGGDLTRTEAYSFWAKNDVGYWNTPQLNSGQIGEARRVEDRFTMEYLGTVIRPITDDLRVDWAFGAQGLTTRTDLTNVTGQGLVTNETRSVNAAATLSSGGQSSSQDRSYGIFTQANFSWRERLYIQAGVRRDEASSFGIDTEPFYSPKIGASYVISEEPYFQNLTGFLPETFLTGLRLRAAYGITGRQPTSGARSTYSPTTVQISPTAVSIGVSPSATGNPLLKPEKGQELELGFEAGMLDDKLSLDVTYFNKKTVDAILTQPVPASTGASGPSVNVGELLNKGWEIAATARPITRQNVALELRVAGNTLHNEILDLGGIPETTTLRPGFPLSGEWDYRIKEIDVANNRVVVSDTLEFIGNDPNLPGWDANVSGTLTLFQNLSFYAQIDGRGDRIVYNSTDEFRERQFSRAEVSAKGAAAYGVDADGQPTEEAKRKYMSRFGCIGCPSTRAFVTTEGRELSRNDVDFGYQEDGTFFKLREVSATYRVPNTIVQNYLRARSLNLTLAMRNLHTWTDFTGLDPESDQFLTVPQDRRWTVKFLFTF